MRSIPFTLPDDGFTEVNGTIYLDAEFLVFEVVTALLGEFDKEHQVIKIEPSALEYIYLDEGIFRDKLVIRPKKRDLLTAMPGTYVEALTLKIWNKHRTQAEQLVTDVLQRIDEKSNG